MSVVVDTNVAMVASRIGAGADDLCVTECIARLQQVCRDGGLLADDSGLILGEYTRSLGFSGQPGAGHYFAKWAHDHQAIPEAVRVVAITPRSDGGWRRFEEFPDQAELARFDRSDQKFVAVAMASAEHPRVLNAVDSDWWIHRSALAAAGVNVDFLCPQRSVRR